VQLQEGKQTQAKTKMKRWRLILSGEEWLEKELEEKVCA